MDQKLFVYGSLVPSELAYGLIEDLIGGQPHPNMRLPMEAISDQSKINHYTHEHGYLPENNNDNLTPENMKILNKMHEDYHKSANPEDEWNNFAWQRGPSGGGGGPSNEIALPHEHWDTIEGDPKDIDKNEDLLSSMDAVSYTHLTLPTKRIV